jgi:hypothetical protein
MKTAERDELLRRQVEATEETAMFLARSAEALELPERRRRMEEYDAQRPPLRLLFGGEEGLKLLARQVPGWAAVWQDLVPAEYLLQTTDRRGESWLVVHCPCGHQTPIAPASLAACACERWFLRGLDTVRVKRFEETE